MNRLQKVMVFKVKQKNRDFGVYNGINDNYPKYVVSLDKMNHEYNDIKYINLIKFL